MPSCGFRHKKNLRPPTGPSSKRSLEDICCYLLHKTRMRTLCSWRSLLYKSMNQKTCGNGFMQCKTHFPNIDNHDVGIISDRDKGLNAALSNMDNITQLWCCKHIERNIISNKISDFDLEKYWELCKVVSKSSFEEK